MKTTKNHDAQSTLAKIGKRLLIAGGACILGTVITLIGAGVYESLGPAGTNLVQHLAMLLPWTVIPIGCSALILGVLLRFIAHVARPKGHDETARPHSQPAGTLFFAGYAMRSQVYWLLLVAVSLLSVPSGCSEQPDRAERVAETSSVEEPASATDRPDENAQEPARPTTNTDVLPAAEKPDAELVQELEKDGNAFFKLSSTGEKLTEDQVKSLEEKLRQNPKDLVTRAKLIGFYSPRQGRGREQKTELMRKYAPLVLGIIENHPESNLAGQTGAMLLARFFEMGDQGDWDKGLKLWMKLVDENPTNAQIMGQAAIYISWDAFRPQDKAIALLEKACELDPENSDWPARLGSLLMRQVTAFQSDKGKTTAQKALRHLERAIQLGGPRDAPSYALLVEAAFHAEEWEKAATYGNDALKRLDATKKDWNFGNLVHHTHVLLGRVALRDGNLDLAKQHLLEAGTTPGSPQLNSFGPSMILARELLEKGEKETVLQYFELCRKFWKSGSEYLDTWTKAVEEGKTPDFKGKDKR